MKKDLTIKQRKISEKKFKEWKQKLKEKTFVLTGEDMHNLYDCLDIAKASDGFRDFLVDNRLYAWFYTFFDKLKDEVVPKLKRYKGDK